MSGLVGNVAIPKQTGAATGYWIETEGNPPTESQPTVGQVTLSPKNVAAWVDITRNLMKQATPAADVLVLNDIVRVLARMIDLAVFHGTGANGQPTGIATAAAGGFTGATFSWILAISALTDVMNANAEKDGMKWVCNPTSWGILKTREKGTAGYPVYLCGDDDRMAAFPVLTSTQITAANLFFGDFTQAVIGEWGVLDINIDDKSLSTSGGIRIVGYQSVDVAVRQSGAFTLATDLS
jgi:HK97 family phage major capsid protein